MAYAEVIFNLPVNQSFTYRIPGELRGLKPGFRVLAPFGKRTLTGVVTAIIRTTNFPYIRDLIDIIDEKPLLSRKMLALTKWISEYYMSGWGQAVQLALPKGSERRVQDFIELGSRIDDTGLTEKQRELYILIGSDPGKTKDFYRKKFGQSSFYSILKTLQELGLIKLFSRTRPGSVSTLFRQFVQVPEDYDIRKGRHPDYLKYIAKKPHVDALMKELAGTRISRTGFLEKSGMAEGTLQKMNRMGVLTLSSMPVERKPMFSYEEVHKEISLTSLQKEVIAQILGQYALRKFAAFLLHGVTGSGKTQVYIEVLTRVLAGGQNAIILIPEIALTPQTVGRFRKVFGDHVAVFHSRMSLGERYDAWMACFHKEVRIVIGPRSALFVPLTNIGIIIVDEEHESSYKQADVVPRYHARDVAIYWAKMNNALIVLGSATPSLESYYNARMGKYRLLEIPERVSSVSMPEVSVVDVRGSRSREESKIFCPMLREKLGQRLRDREQIILLQNRRGYSSFQQCVRCGHLAVCPKCEISLTYHSYNEIMLCHFCGYTEPPADYCPSCGGDQIRYSGAGTQRIQEELARLFPDARVLRMDLDTTRGKDMYDRMLQSFGKGEADILLGTQMVAKGLDFPNVTLVGVISADIGLTVPDFRSAERVFQLMMQVSGRSGRSHKPGEVIIQCMNTSHYVIQLARKHDYHAFFEKEIGHRSAADYPPYSRLIKLLVITDSLNETISVSRVLAAQIKRVVGRDALVIGPAPDLIPRLNNQYRWQIHLKMTRRNEAAAKAVKTRIQAILKPFTAKPKKGVTVSVDVDPYAA